MVSLTLPVSIATSYNAAALTNVLDFVPAGIVVLDRNNGTITYVNETAISLCGVDPRGLEMSEHSTKLMKMLTLDGEVYPPDRLPASLALLTGKEAKGEVVIERPDGTRIITSATARPIRNESGEIVAAIGIFEDITERKKSEQALSESEERYRHLFESMAEMFQSTELVRDENGKVIDCIFLDVNPAFLSFYKKRREEVVGKRAREIFTTVQDCWLEAFERVAKTGEPAQFEAHGEYDKYYSAYAWKVCHDRVAVITLDVTERKDAERKLRRQASIIDLSPDAIIIRALDGTIEFWSAGAEKLYGYSKKEALGRKTHELLKTKFPRPLEEIYSELMLTGMWSGELRHMTRGGDEVIVESQWLIERPTEENGAGPRVIVSNVDITEKRKAIEALEESNRNLDRLVRRRTEELDALSKLHEMSTRLVGQDEMKGLLDEFLRAAMELTHTNKGTIQSTDKDGNMQIVAHRGLKQPFLDFFNHVTSDTHVVCGVTMSSKKRVIVEDVTVSLIYVGTAALKIILQAGIRAVQSTPLVTRSGEVIGVISTHFGRPTVPDEFDLRLLDLLARQAADLIERMRHKEELDSYARRLEALVKDRTKQLEQALENERRSRRRAELLHDILSHDMRNYNQVIKLSAELLELELAGVKDVSPLFKQLLEAVDSSTELLERAKKLGKLISEESPILSDVDLVGALDSSLELIKRANTRKHVSEIRTILAPQGKGSRKILARADDLIVEVFANLFANAVNYTDSANVKISIELDLVKIEDERSPEPTEYWKISITDWGHGIPPEMKERMFERYLSSAKGTGLGMSIVQALVVERYKGKLVVKDRVVGDRTKGTTVEVYLPKAS